MRKLKIVFFVLVMTSFSAFSGNGTPEEKEKAQLRNQIVKLLGDYESKLETGTLMAEVTFLLNKKGKIVIVSVETSQDHVISYIKRKLNYQKVNVATTKRLKIYRLPLKIVKK